ncbi:MAG: phosphatidylglycerophosphatase A, partial [Alphaproteobacteria bacterium]|nr:phosphatidylglycerophosphatase A [Alphaproteobacteria bacterium]
LKYTEHDPSLVVIDEVCGQAICCIPTAIILEHAKTDVSGMCVFYGIAFLLFRLFDITKPLLIGFVDRKMENAVGVMLDDVLAGVCGAIVWGILFLTFIYIAFSGAFFQ